MRVGRIDVRLAREPDRVALRAAGARGWMVAAVRPLPKGGVVMPRKEKDMETTMDDVKVEAYEQPVAGWAGCVSAKDGSWIVWIGTDGRASLYDTRGDIATCVGTVERKESVSL